jgi:hypothetical protein
MSKSFPEWWKHGQKVRTASDGVLTLNIAEDAEYWLTNDAGKEVSVFSADILGPVSIPEACGTNITELAQRKIRSMGAGGQMKERPVIFNGEMVRAILEGRKTQTRRALNWKRQPYTEMSERDDGSLWPWAEDGERGGDIWFPCPFGEVGDQLWVRETFMDLTGTGIEATTGKFEGYAYRADSPPGSYGDESRKEYGLKWTPSLHMPRKACRILLEITAVRVEQLNDISEEDARAEGVRVVKVREDGERYCDYLSPEINHYRRPSDSFISLWASIYGEESWQDSPWCWVIEFKRVGGSDASK